MEQRRFNLTMAGLLGLVLLSSSPLGAMLGLFLGLTVALFVGPIMWMLASALGTDLEVVMRPILIALGVGFGVFVFAVLAKLVAALRRADDYAARRHAATLAFLVAVPAILWLSSQALVDAWP